MNQVFWTMTAILKLKAEDLTSDWFAKVKADYADADLELHIKTSTKTQLGEDEFWAVIDQLDWEAENELAIVAPAVQVLSKYEIGKIYAFQELFAQKLYALDTPAHAQHIGDASWSSDSYFSVDHFLYARACVVAHGKEVYEEVLTTPKEMPDDCTFEALLRLASDAFEQKTGRSFHYIPSVSYETYQNEEAWASVK
ncbi:MAG: DUF4240 domain-containing protein [Bacteroidota bacterium]